MSLSLRASAPPASSSTGSPQPVVRSLKAFSLYASPHEETAAMVAARRALMSRKSLSVEEANERARERRRAASQIQRFDRPARWLALALFAAGAGRAFDDHRISPARARHRPPAHRPACLRW